MTRPVRMVTRGSRTEKTRVRSPTIKGAQIGRGWNTIIDDKSMRSFVDRTRYLIGSKDPKNRITGIKRLSTIIEASDMNSRLHRDISTIAEKFLKDRNPIVREVAVEVLMGLGKVERVLEIVKRPEFSPHLRIKAIKETKGFFIMRRHDTTGKYSRINKAILAAILEAYKSNNKTIQLAAKNSILEFS